MKNKMSSISQNYIYNVLYQILSFMLPLITAPYISRIFGPNNVGIYSYTQACASYFVLFSMLGVNNYGNRSIAKCRDNNDELRETFWNIYLIQCVVGIILTVIFICVCRYQLKDYGVIAYCQLFYVVTGIFDISWLFFGLEKFKVTVSRNFFIKISTVILVFIFVKAESDLWKYTLIMAGGQLLACLYLWIYLPKRIRFVLPSLKKVLDHLKPDIILFVPVVAISLYKIMDKIMLGSMTTTTQVGYYENAAKIINVPAALITALGTVMMPRIANVIQKGDIKKCKQYISNSMMFIAILSSSCMFGLIACANEIVLVMFGRGFEQSGVLIVQLALTIPFVAWANVIRTQYLIPNVYDKVYLVSVIFGAFINLIANGLLIPLYQSQGAAAATVLAESVVCITQTWMIRHQLPIWDYVKEMIFFMVGGSIMFLSLKIFDTYCVFNYASTTIEVILRLFIKIVFGALIYSPIAFIVIKHLKWQEKKDK